MKKLILTIILLIPYLASSQYNYPPTRIVDSSDTWHGITIPDPYRWLEDLNSDEVQKWFKAQADFTNNYMEDLKYTDDLYNEFLKFDSIQPDKIYDVNQIGNTFFYFNLKLGDSKPKIYKRDGEYGNEELLAESEVWGNDYTISGYEIDPYQKYIAITAAENGKEIQIAKFYSIDENRFLNDSVPGSFAGFASVAGQVIYYKRPTWDVHVSVKEKETSYISHILGSNIEADKLFISFDTNPEFYTYDDSYSPWFTSYNSSFNYELIFVANVSPFMQIYSRPAKTNNQWKQIISFEDKVAAINGYNNNLYFISLSNSPNGKLMMIDMKNPDAKNSKLISAEKDIPIEMGWWGTISHTKNFLILKYNKNGVRSFTDVIDMRTNTVTKVPFQETTNIMNVTPLNKSHDDVQIERTGWTSPKNYTYSNLDVPFEKEKIFPFQQKVSCSSTDEITVEEIEIPSHDGIMVPVSLIYKKDLSFNGKNMAFVYGYGSYGISISAVFTTKFLVLANKGIVIAVAHVRGGGEKGESWHLAGQKQAKCNTWKDLNACAEYLIDKGFTSPKQLVCEGGSAGGILIGRAITERPDLWGCAIPRVGCLTMVRDETTPNGPINTSEFGTVRDVNDFFGLLEMDALLHVVNETEYPAMLITTGWNDPRVISWQPAKFAAAVQKASKSSMPILLYVDYTSGHFNSDDKFARYLQFAQSYAFAMEQCGYQSNSAY